MYPVGIGFKKYVSIKILLRKYAGFVFLIENIDKTLDDLKSKEMSG